MKPEQIATINTIVEHLPRCNCKSPTHDEGCIVPMLLDLHRQANATEHFIQILKRDRNMEIAKRLAEEELTEIYGPYTDNTIRMDTHEFTELYALEGLKGYTINIVANLTDEELTDIQQRQHLRERRLITNIGRVTIDNEDIGILYKQFGTKF
jgi:hypothetical protein